MTLPRRQQHRPSRHLWQRRIRALPRRRRPRLRGNKQGKKVPIELNRCYDSDDVDAPGLMKTLSSFQSYAVGIPSTLICEGKAFFEKKCAGSGAVSNNFNGGVCINSYQSPSTEKPLGGQVPGPAKSFMMDCCVANNDKNGCAPPVC
jgi:hypothetical protein